MRKAENKVANLARLILNVRGRSSRKREIIAGVFYSIALYGGPV